MNHETDEIIMVVVSQLEHNFELMMDFRRIGLTTGSIEAEGAYRALLTTINNIVVLSSEEIKNATIKRIMDGGIVPIDHIAGSEK